MKIYYNKKCNIKPIYKKENKIYLWQKNLRIKRLNDKLNFIKLRLFKIKKVYKLITIKLKLLKNIQIHLVFYIILLELTLKNTLLILSIKVKL